MVPKKGTDHKIIWWKVSQVDVVWTTLVFEQWDLSICFTLTVQCNIFVLCQFHDILGKYLRIIWLLYIHYIFQRLLTENPNLGKSFELCFGVSAVAQSQGSCSEGKVSVRQNSSLFMLPCNNNNYNNYNNDNNNNNNYKVRNPCRVSITL